MKMKSMGTNQRDFVEIIVKAGVCLSRSSYHCCRVRILQNCFVENRTAETRCGEWINLPMPLSTNDRCGSRGNQLSGFDQVQFLQFLSQSKVEHLGGFLKGNILLPFVGHLWESL